MVELTFFNPAPPPTKVYELRLHYARPVSRTLWFAAETLPQHQRVRRIMTILAAVLRDQTDYSYLRETLAEQQLPEELTQEGDDTLGQLFYRSSSNGVVSSFPPIRYELFYYDSESFRYSAIIEKEQPHEANH